jgi:hypothetical protein
VSTSGGSALMPPFHAGGFAVPKFIVIHHSPGVTREQFAENVPDILLNKHATFLHCYANMAEGTIVNFYDADDAAAVEREMERIGFPFDEIAQVQFEGSADDLRAMA